LLRIRSQQVPSLLGEPVHDYERHALEYVRRSFPHELERRGEDGIAALVARAIGDAVGYRLQSSVDVTGLLSLMLLLGEDFAAAPQYAWIREILASTVIHASDKLGMILETLGE
jgi:hypothetical protein